MRALGLIGPLAGWEFRRLIRRGLALRVWLLLLYLLALTFVVFTAFWFYPQPFQTVFPGLSRLTSTEANLFASRSTLALLEVQFVFVVLLAPALAASAVAEEKDRHTLPLLLTTQLTDREIVFGKAMGRIAFMLAVISGGFPVLMLPLCFGRVDLAFLLAGYAITLGTVALCAAIGMNAACQAPDFRSALLRAYGRVAALMWLPLVCAVFVPWLVFLSPFGFLPLMQSRSEGGVWLIVLGCSYTLVQVLVGVWFLANAARAIRLRDASAGPLPVSDFPLPPRPADPPLLQPEHSPRPQLPPLDAANPVLWKERCVGWQPTWAMPSVAKGLGLLVAVAAVLLFVIGAGIVLDRVRNVLESTQVEPLVPRPRVPDGGGWLLATAGVFAAGRYLLPLAVGLSGAIAGERFRRTLDSLLSTPLDRRLILRAKVQSHAERGTAFAAVAVAAVGMAFTADADIRLGASAAALILGSIALVIGLGAWLTVRCTSDVHAFRVLLLFTMPSVAWPAGVWQLLQSDANVPRELLTQAILTAAIASAIVGAVFWWLAERKMVNGDC